MSTERQFPTNMRPVSLYMGDGNRLELQALSYEDAVLRIFNASGERVAVSAALEIYSYRDSKYLVLSGDEVPLSMSDSYTFRYDDNIILQQGRTFGKNEYTLSEEFEFPLTAEEQRKANSLRYTALVLGSFNQGSFVVKVSSTEGAAIGRSVIGQGVADDSCVTGVNAETDEITLDKPLLESASRVMLEMK